MRQAKEPSRAKSLVPVFVGVCLPVFALFGLMHIAKVRYGLETDYFTRDVVATLDGKFYTGAVSTLGILLWCATASFYFLTSLVLWKPKDDTRFFLVYSLIFNLVLLFDDQFLFHEEVLPNYLHLSEKLFFAAYAVGMLFYLVKFRRRLLNQDFPLLATALALFACSVVIDVGLEDSSPFHFLFEDGSKFLGIAFWCVYAYRTCHSLISERMGRTTDRSNLE